MIRKFECKNCGHRFEADDQKMVDCPHCQSDNVEIAGFRMPPIVWKVAAAVAVVAVAVLIVLNIDWKKEETTPSNPGIAIIDEIEENDNDTIPTIEGLVEPTTIEVPNLTFEGEGYTFKVRVKNPPSQKVYVGIFDPFDKAKMVAKSDNGVFTGVPYSEADGASYTIALVDAAADTIVCSIDKPGFIKQAAVDKRMTSAELQQKIDSRDESLMGVGGNDYLAPDVKLTFTGLPADAVNVPTTLYEVFEKLDMESWAQVKVTALDYDDKNRIAAITMKVVLPADDF